MFQARGGRIFGATKTPKSMNFSTLRLLALVSLLFLLAQGAKAQGVTTAAITGQVLDQNGAPLVGATVKATHLPTNSIFGAFTTNEGRFFLGNLKVGGPYTIEVSFIGYRTSSMENVSLSLSQTLEQSFSLTEESVSVDEVVITGEVDPVLNSSRTGAANTISEQQINALPTISRNFSDFVQLTPQVSGVGNNATFGRSARYNNFQVDGSILTDLFGLSGNGESSLAGQPPISFDAIQEYQVVLSPYDVRQSGFTGVGVNAITRSGDNTIRASVYGFYQDESMIGKPTQELVDAGTPDEKLDEFTQIQTGFRIGGPIIKDKLFFFVNAEITDNTSPLVVEPTGAGFNGQSPILTSDLNEIQRVLRDQYGYDAGGYGSTDLSTSSTKFFARFDYTINENHALTFRYNYSKIEDQSLFRTSTSFSLGNSQYDEVQDIHTAVVELRSSFGTNKVNNFIFSFTTIDKEREPQGERFPNLRISLPEGTVYAGPDAFSTDNKIVQSVIELKDNFSIYQGKHVFTFGTDNQLYSFDNTFLPNSTGSYRFNSIADLSAGAASRYEYSFNPSGGAKNAEAKYMQVGFFAQDEWSVTEKLKVTAGIRVDIPFSLDEPKNNPAFEAESEYSTSSIFDTQLLLSPRLGFNFDVMGDRSLILRGGAGIFTGRVPFVWVLNGFVDNGLDRATYITTNTTFVADPNNQPTGGATASSSILAVTDPDFKFPQVARFDIGVDYKLPLDFVLTGEFIYNHAVNEVKFENAGLAGVVDNSQYDGRQLYGNPVLGVGDNSVSPTYNTSSFQNIILLSNTDRGYSHFTTLQVSREDERSFFRAAYTYSNSQEVNNTVSSQAFSNPRRNPIVNDVNDPALSTSDYQVEHRVLVAGGYRFEYLDGKMATTVSLIYNGQSGRPYSFIYDGDINGDAFDENDLIYIPASRSEVRIGEIDGSGNFVEDVADADEFWNYINSDEYLSKNKGKFADKGGAEEDWLSSISVRLAQDFAIKAGNNEHRLQLTLDILNFGALLDRNAGVVRQVTNQRQEVIDFDGYANDGLPVFSLSDLTGQTIQDLSSRWSMQFGLRYFFN